MENQVTDQVQSWADVLQESVSDVLSSLADFLPNLVGAFLLLILGILLANLVESITRRIMLRLENLRVFGKERVDEQLDKIGLRFSLSNVVAKTLYWLVILVVLMGISNILGLTVIAEAIADLIGYIPNLIAALIILAITISGANLVRGVVLGSLNSLKASYSRLLANIAFVVIVFFGSLTAIDQLGIDTTIITANITVILGGVMLAFAIAVGLGGKDLVASMIAGYFLKKELKEGDKISLEGISGKIEKITETNLFIKQEKDTVVVPLSRALKR